MPSQNGSKASIREVHELLKDVHQNVYDLRSEMKANDVAVRRELETHNVLIRKELQGHYSEDAERFRLTSVQIGQVKTWGAAGMVLLTIVGILVPVLAK